MKVLIGNLTKITSTDYVAAYSQYVDVENTPDFINDGIVVESGEIDFSKPSKIIHYNPTTNSVFYEYPEVPKTQTEILQDQISTLESTILEMSTYSAKQDERIAMQEQAILELTTLISGGNA